MYVFVCLSLFPSLAHIHHYAFLFKKPPKYYFYLLTPSSNHPTTRLKPQSSMEQPKFGVGLMDLFQCRILAVLRTLCESVTLHNI